MAKPLQLTQSSYITEDRPAYEADATLQELFTNAGYDLNDYEVLNLRLTQEAFWQSPVGPNLQCVANGITSALFPQFATTQVFQYEDIPLGSVIVVKDGYQYRPEGWITLRTKTPSRPGNVTQRITTVTDYWWSNWDCRAFNLSKVSGDAKMEDLLKCFAIFVPKKPDKGSRYDGTVEEVFQAAGYSLDDYKEIIPDLTRNAYYNSTQSSILSCAATGSTAANLSQFAATQIYQKEDLPTGTVLVMCRGLQYRPEGWTDLNTKNSEATRPANIFNQIVVVNDAWWGSWNYRAFNLAVKNNPNLTAAQMDKLVTGFAFFIPKATGIHEILSTNVSDVENGATIYDIYGRKVGNANSHLKAGVYISKGRKYIVK